MKNYFLFLCCLLPIAGFAQIEIDRNDLYLLSQRNAAFGKNDSARHLLNFDIKYHLNSNAITNDFLKGLLYSGFIENTQKDQVTERLKNVNRAGYDFNAGFTYQYRVKPDLMIVAGLNQRQQFNSKFSKDIFELIFRGNKQYVGKSAALSPLSVNYFDYQNLFLGVQKNINSKLIVGGGLSIIRGGNFNSIKIDRGTLYTDPNGSYLDFDMKFKLAFSESNSFFASNGIGAAVNFNASLLQEKGRLNFEVRDLGLIKWKDLKVYEGDSLFRYDGVNVNDILDFGDSTFTQVKADSIAEDFGAKRKTEDIAFMLPATFHVNYAYDFSDKITLVAGVKYLIRANYIPRVYLKGIYYFKKNLFVAPMLAYGGFGKMDFELAAAMSFREKFIVSANVFYMEYLLIPKKSAGQGFNVSLTKLF